MSSQRNRSGRGSNRNNGGDVGEEVDLWKNIQGGLHIVVDIFNEHSDNAQKIHDLDKIVHSNKKAHSPGFGDSRNQLEQTIRAGVKICERDKLSNASSQIKELIENLTVLKGIQDAKEKVSEPASSSSGRAASSRASAAAAAALYDFDVSGDAVPSPLGGGGRTKLGSDGSGGRGSVPPRGDRGTPARVGSMEPQPGSDEKSRGGSARPKITFVKDEEVAFKPKPMSNEETYWILGIVQQVTGEGKSRRYKVLDPEPDETTGKQKEYRTSASSMIPIPRGENAVSLPPWEKGKTVLAMYPGTTTFYKAEVMGSDPEGKVNLRFEGEENATTMQAVERRYVVEYRG